MEWAEEVTIEVPIRNTPEDRPWVIDNWAKANCDGKVECATAPVASRDVFWCRFRFEDEADAKKFREKWGEFEPK